MIKDNSSRYTAMEGEKLMVDGNGCDTVRTQGVNFLTGWSSLKVVPPQLPVVIKHGGFNRNIMGKYRTLLDNLEENGGL